MGLSFSPDGRYLGIVEKLADGSNAVVVWDVQEDRMRSHIAISRSFSDYPGVELTWTPDGKYLTFGNSGRTYPIQFWNPMTGALAKEAPASVSAYALHFNSDGSKVLAENAPIARSSVFRIYNVDDWSYQEVDEKDLYIRALSWVGDSQVLVLGSVRRNEAGAEATAQSAKLGFKENDAVARLIDLTGQRPPTTVMLAPSLPHVVERNGVSRTWYEDQLVSFPFLLPDHQGGRVLAGFGHIISTKTMDVLTYASIDELVTHKYPGELDQRNASISPDGAYIYLKGSARPGSNEARNLVLDANTGKPAFWFKGGHESIAVSPDGKWLATGDGSSISIARIE